MQAQNRLCGNCGGQARTLQRPSLRHGIYAYCSLCQTWFVLDRRAGWMQTVSVPEWVQLQTHRKE